MCNIFLGIFSKNCRFFRKKAGFSGHETAKKVIVSITYRASCSGFWYNIRGKLKSASKRRRRLRELAVLCLGRVVDLEALLVEALVGLLRVIDERPPAVQAFADRVRRAHDGYVGTWLAV